MTATTTETLVKKPRRVKKKKNSKDNITETQKYTNTISMNNTLINEPQISEPQVTGEHQTPEQKINEIHQAILAIIKDSTEEDIVRFELNAGGFDKALTLYTAIPSLLNTYGVDTITESQVNLLTGKFNLPYFVVSSNANTSTKTYPSVEEDILDPDPIEVTDTDVLIQSSCVLIFINIILLSTCKQFSAYISSLINCAVDGTFMLGKYYISVSSTYLLLLGIFDIIFFTVLYHKIIAKMVGDFKNEK